jgi:outer membrane protein assembly factor BamE (lipoprotein component of BamABCDE complex)
LLVWLLIASALAAELSACGEPSIPTVTITARDFAFDMPDTLPEGFVAVALSNQGQEPHQAVLARLDNGVTQQQFLTTLASGGLGGALGAISLVGGPDTIDPNASQTVIVKLVAGTYVALCFVASPDGHSHVEKGMIKFFSVDTSTDDLPAAPHDDGLVTLSEFNIALPASVAAGTITWKVWNQGTQPHEMALLKLASGKSTQDVLTFLQQPSGQPPFIDAGGIAGLGANTTSWVTLNLSKGDYMVLSFLPDPTTGQPDIARGMLRSFTVK